MQVNKHVDIPDKKKNRHWTKRVWNKVVSSHAHKPSTTQQSTCSAVHEAVVENTTTVVTHAMFVNEVLRLRNACQKRRRIPFIRSFNFESNEPNGKMTGGDIDTVDNDSEKAKEVLRIRNACQKKRYIPNIRFFKFESDEPNDQMTGGDIDADQTFIDLEYDPKQLLTFSLNMLEEPTIIMHRDSYSSLAMNNNSEMLGPSRSIETPDSVASTAGHPVYTSSENSSDWIVASSRRRTEIIKTYQRIIKNLSNDLQSTEREKKSNRQKRSNLKPRVPSRPLANVNKHVYTSVPVTSSNNLENATEVDTFPNVKGSSDSCDLFTARRLEIMTQFRRIIDNLQEPTSVKSVKKRPKRP
ncbi:hypothetical protein V1514DRAFT_336316, partial [Lipomyces japonicus]|uniref:uncharacterized protein n=1 Tax=Lipomyces japonicus TaxID=56871 RepID=UPI0034CD7727